MANKRHKTSQLGKGSRRTIFPGVPKQAISPYQSKSTNFSRLRAKKADEYKLLMKDVDIRAFEDFARCLNQAKVEVAPPIREPEIYLGHDKPKPKLEDYSLKGGTVWLGDKVIGTISLVNFSINPQDALLLSQVSQRAVPEHKDFIEADYTVVGERPVGPFDHLIGKEIIVQTVARQSKECLTQSEQPTDKGEDNAQMDQTEDDSGWNPQDAN